MLVAGILPLDQEEAVKYKGDGQQLVEKIKEDIDRGQLIGLIFTDDSQHEIADHGPSQREEHLVQLLEEEYGEDAI